MRTLWTKWCPSAGSTSSGTRCNYQNAVFQNHIKVTFSAIVCLSLFTHFSLKRSIISVCDTKKYNKHELEQALKPFGETAYSAKLLRFLPASALFVNNVFLLFILILKKRSQTNKSYSICRVLVSPCSEASRSPAGLQRLDFHYDKTANRNALVFCISSHVQCCSFNIYATIYEDLCCSRILKKACTYLVLQ